MLMYSWHLHFEGFWYDYFGSNGLWDTVITSNVSSLPEVAGDAAILVDPMLTGNSKAVTVFKMTLPTVIG